MAEMSPKLESNSLQQSRDSEGYSESVPSESALESTDQTSFCSDQAITASQPIALTDSNFAKVYNVLYEVGDKWFNLGLQLGIAPAKLKDIENKYQESGSALREVLLTCRTTALKDVIMSLCTPTVDQQVCARELENLVTELQHDEETSTDNHSTDVTDRKNHPFVRKLTKREAQKTKCTYHFEVVVVGDPTVGKTATLNKYLGKYPDIDTGRTTVVAFQHEPHVFNYKDKCSVQLILCDMPGNDDCFAQVKQCYFESADGAILMFDVTNKQSFINLVSDEGNSRKIGKSWMKELMFKAVDYRHPAMVFFGNKIDAERREIQESDVNQMLKSQNLDIPYFEISAEENLNVEHAFTSIIEMLINKADKDNRYGKPIKVSHCNDSSIQQASSATPSFNPTLGPRTKSLPASRAVRTTNTRVPPAPVPLPTLPEQQSTVNSTESTDSSHPQSRSNKTCVLL